MNAGEACWWPNNPNSISLHSSRKNRYTYTALRHDQPKVERRLQPPAQKKIKLASVLLDCGGFSPFMWGQLSEGHGDGQCRLASRNDSSSTGESDASTDRSLLGGTTHSITHPTGTRTPLHWIKHPMACVSGRLTGLPAATATSASRRSCSVAAGRFLPSAAN